LIAGLRVDVLAVVRLVRQAQPRLQQVNDVCVRIGLGREDVVANTSAGSLALQAPDGRGKGVRVLGGVDGREGRGERLNAKSVEEIRVHEARPQRADEVLLW